MVQALLMVDAAPKRFDVARLARARRPLVSLVNAAASRSWCVTACGLDSSESKTRASDCSMEVVLKFPMLALKRCFQVQSAECGFVSLLGRPSHDTKETPRTVIKLEPEAGRPRAWQES